MQAELKGLDLVVYSVQNGVLLLQGFAHRLPNAFHRSDALLDAVQSLVLLGLGQLPVLLSECTF